MALTIPNRTLFQALAASRRQNGGKTLIAQDHTDATLSLGKLLQGACALGSVFKSYGSENDAIGVLLPTAIPTILTFFALHQAKRIPAMLSAVAGTHDLLAACSLAKIGTIVTSRKFVELAELDDKIASLSSQATIVYLEDVKRSLSLKNKLVGLFAPISALFSQGDPHKPAVILFTSGSEAVPKGVVLSHRNLLANLAQLQDRVDFTRKDVFFNALPMFHSFGLMVGLLLPVLCGLRGVLYPSPLHYKIIPERIRAAKPTMMFSTDTFLSGYARTADKDDFKSLRAIFAGAEKLKDTTRELYLEKFGVTVLQGYGVTETAPVIAVNVDGAHEPGTVGKPLSDIECRLEPVEGIQAGGRLHVKGPNVMLGYLKAEGAFSAPKDGWHDTGDIVSINERGFLTILGRAKRFAKIAGEMVSLTAVEALAHAAYPDAMHAAISRPDAARGEKIVLLSADCDVERSVLIAQAHQNGVDELFIPKEFVKCGELPVLPTGKIDYVTLMKRYGA